MWDQPQDERGRAVADHERDQRLRVALGPVVDPAGVHGGGHRGETLEHADPAPDRGEVSTTEDVAHQGPRHRVHAVTERKQDGEEHERPPRPVTVRQHDETGGAQQDPHGADHLLRLPVAEPPRQRPDDHGRQRREPDVERRRRLVEPFPDQERHQVHGHPGIGDVAQAVKRGEQPERRRSQSLPGRELLCVAEWKRGPERGATG